MIRGTSSGDRSPLGLKMMIIHLYVVMFKGAHMSLADFGQNFFNMRVTRVLALLLNPKTKKHVDILPSI